MIKILIERYIAVLSILLSLILTVTLYAYTGDQEAIKKSISIEAAQRSASDSLLNISIIEKIATHESIDSERNIRIETDIDEIKQANIRMEGKLDKVIFNLNKN